MVRWPSIPELVKDVKSGNQSAAALVQDCLAREAEHEDHHALLEINQQATVRAEYIDAKIAEGKTAGDLLGIPFVVKDNFLTSTTKTTAASRLLETFRSPYQATVVDKLEAAGAICLGTANLDEFAHGSSTENSAFGPTKNPFDITRVPGGSSGGSAAAVALDIAPLALGTDTGGSIRLPAGWCGVVGLKPSYGLISRYGVVAMASSTDVVGPITRTVPDSAYVLDILAGRDPRDSTTIERDSSYRLNKPKGLKNLKVGVIKEQFGEGVTASTKAVIERKVEALRSAGAQILEINIPTDSLALAIYYIIVPAEISSNLARYDGIKYGTSDPSAETLFDVYVNSRGNGLGLEPIRRIITGTYVLASGYQEAYYKKAQSVRTLLRQEYERAFRKVDVLVGPTAPDVAFKLGEKQDPLTMYMNDILVISANLTGVPAISIPAGFGPDNLPIGLQLMTAARQDKKLLEIAAAVEALV